MFPEWGKPCFVGGHAKFPETEPPSFAMPGGTAHIVVCLSVIPEG